MYIVTNRKVSKRKGSFEIFEKTPNSNGPNELRLLKMDKENGKRVFTRLNDKISQKRVKEINSNFNLSLDEKKKWFASLDVACNLFNKAKIQSKNILVFVHGYNNDMNDIIVTAEKLEKAYNVLVLVFSWPANGGGFFSGTAQYVGDKSDARVSTGALNRFLEKLHNYHAMLTTAQVDSLWRKAKDKHIDNHEEARSEYAKLQQKMCKININLLCHSMGNYVLKYATIPSDTSLDIPIFDNVCLVAADVNNKKHAEWVEKIEARSGVYVVINKNDSALKWSRVKPGKAQQARLGHYIKSLNAQNTTYIDVSSAKYVDDDHSYFKDNPIEKNLKLKALFSDLFEGRKAEEKLEYKADINAYIPFQ